LASLLVAVTVYAVTFRSLPSLFPSAMVADVIGQTDCRKPEVVSTFAYQEPSLVFLLGTGTRFSDGAGAADFLRGGPCHFALVDQRSERSFVQRAESTGLRYSLTQRVDGFNISIGKPVSLTIFRSQDGS
ncbi:MAG TPA: glycosyl transferase, partial [Pseudolabrys sp.]|nr:glycosyl transferase [Pseudolabrys sp.]